MQRINGNITDFGMEPSSKTLTFQLVSRFFKPINASQAETLLKSVTTQSDGSFEIELTQNDAIDVLTFYAVYIDIASILKIIYIPYTQKESLHIQCLNQITGSNDFITFIQHQERFYEFSETFIKTLDKYFVKNSSFVTRSQERLIQKFYTYCEETDETKKCDFCRSLDEALGNY